MKIAGFLKNSFVDYPGQIACVLFVPGCNLNCYYCHNRHLLGNNINIIDQKEIMDFLKSRTGFIDAVVITGGEPTLQKDLEDFIKEIRKLGFLIKLDTNGFRPDILHNLMEKDLLSYIAVDFKAPYSKYGMISDKKCDIGEFIKTVRLLIGSDMDYEFRTTFVPELTTADLLKIAEEIKGSSRYCIQQFRPYSAKEGITDMRAIKRPHSKEYVLQAAESVKKVLTTTNVSVRGVK